jgi:hypothetical protein
MDIIAIQRILNDAIKEYTITASVPHEVLVSLISVDIYRKLNAKAQTPAPRPQTRRSVPKNVPGQISLDETHGE